MQDDGGSTETESVSDTSMYGLFWKVWPLVSVWLAEQREHAACKWRLRRLVRVYFKKWVDEADIFPPPLVSSSDSEQGYMDMLRDSAFSSSGGSDDSDDEEFNNSALGQLIREHRERMAARSEQMPERFQFRPWDHLRESFIESRAYFLRPFLFSDFSIPRGVPATAHRTAGEGHASNTASTLSNTDVVPSRESDAVNTVTVAQTQFAESTFADSSSMLDDFFRPLLFSNSYITRRNDANIDRNTNLPQNGGSYRENTTDIGSNRDLVRGSESALVDMVAVDPTQLAERALADSASTLDD